jgi:hypothetical protein
MSAARDVEAIERTVWEDMYAAAPAAFRAGAKLDCRRFGSVLGSVAAAIPDAQFNRAFGFGVDAPWNEHELDDVIAFMRASGAQRWWLQPSPDDPGLLAAVEARGFTPTSRPWAKLLRTLEHAAPAASNLTIEKIGGNDSEAFGAIVCEAFGAPPQLAIWLAALADRANWRLYLASDDGAPISAAAMWCDRDGAWYGIAGTSKAGRGRGGQTAVLARLINDARAAGARVLVAETGDKQQGSASTSYDNMIRLGFRVVHVRPNYVPPEMR